MGWIPASNDFPPAIMPLAVRSVASTDYATLTKTAPAVVQDNTVFTYTMKVANTAYGSSTNYQLNDALPSNINYVNGSATGGLVYDAGSRTLSASATLNAPVLHVNTSPSPNGYVELDTLGVNPAPCGASSSCDDVILNVSGSGVNFYYLGKQYTSVGISTNGFIVPGGVFADFQYKVPQNFPDAAAPNNVIAPLWTDLDLTPGTGSGNWYIAWVGYTNTSYLVAEWKDAQQYGDASSIYSFEIWVEWGTSNIWFVYNRLDGPNAFTYPMAIGEENSEGNIGSTYFYKKTPVRRLLRTSPVVHTDLATQNLIDSLTATFQAIAPFRAPYKVINVATLTNSHNSLAVSSEATTLIKAWFINLPVVVKNKANP